MRVITSFMTMEVIAVNNKKTVDFSRSYLTFRIDWTKKTPKTVSYKPPYTVNNVRIPLDCRCEITDRHTGQSHQFVLGASCKAERVGAERDIWHEPNADFVPIMSQEQFMFMKSYDQVGKQRTLHPPSLGAQPERQVGNVAEAFDSLRIDLCYCEGEVLETTDQIVEAVLDNQSLVGQTEISNERYVALVEYPIKTINVSERDHIYQPDTGPVLFPDLDREPVDLVAGFELAFVAYNSPDWAEFIVRGPTPLSKEISVYHYSRAVRLDTKNQLFAIGE